MSNEPRTAESIIEAVAGGEYHRACAIADLESAADTAIAEFEYDTEVAAVDLVRMVRELRGLVLRLRITEKAELVAEPTTQKGAARSEGTSP
jgi:hypothetical protein